MLLLRPPDVYLSGFIYHFTKMHKFTIGSPSLMASPSMSPLVRQQSWLKPPRECNKSVVIGVFYAAFGLVIAVIGYGIYLKYICICIRARSIILACCSLSMYIQLFLFLALLLLLLFR